MLAVKPLIAILAALATGVAARPSYIAPDSGALGRRQEPAVSPAISPAVPTPETPAGEAPVSPAAVQSPAGGESPAVPPVPVTTADTPVQSPAGGESPAVPAVPVSTNGTPVQSPSGMEEPVASVSPAVPSPPPAGAGSTTGGIDNLTSLPAPPAGLPEIVHEKTGKRFVAYWSATHGTNPYGTPETGGPVSLPDPAQLQGVTHLILAFVDAKTLNTWQASWATSWGGTTFVKELKEKYPNMKIMAAWGGWGQDYYYREKCATEAGRQELAKTMASFTTTQGLDGLDFDWEYPIGNGEKYLVEANNPNEQYWFVDLAYKVRMLLGGDAIMSAALPGKAGEGQDAEAYNTETIPALMKSLNFFNLMSYDVMNRRDLTAGHHSGKAVMQTTIENYKKRGMQPDMMNVGFPLYAKWFKSDATTCAEASGIGCTFPQYAFEDAKGADQNVSGAYTLNADLMTVNYLGTNFWPKQQPFVEPSWAKVKGAGVPDAAAGATSAWDAEGHIFWTWMSPEDFGSSCQAVLPEVGGVMIWSIDQDEQGQAGGPHIQQLQSCLGGGGGAVASGPAPPEGSGSNFAGGNPVSPAGGSPNNAAGGTNNAAGGGGGSGSGTIPAGGGTNNGTPVQPQQGQQPAQNSPSHMIPGGNAIAGEGPAPVGRVGGAGAGANGGAGASAGAGAGAGAPGVSTIVEMETQTSTIMGPAQTPAV